MVFGLLLGLLEFYEGSPMSEAKNSVAACKRFGVAIQAATAQELDGLCRPCSQGRFSSALGLGDAEKLGISLRLIYGLLFGCILGGVGYGIGSSLGMFIGIVVAFPFALVGFIYGCFLVEINGIIRGMFGN